MSKSSNDSSPVEIPENFAPTIRDFLADLTATFPEYAHLWSKWTSPSNTRELFVYISQVYPERFFDILYQNDDIFKEDSETETRFLPDMDFRMLFHCEGVSDKTREAIWKYLQLILMTILKSVKDKGRFGDTANMFDGVDETVLQEKLKETLEGIGEFFKSLDGSGSNPFESNPLPGFNGESEAELNAKFAEATEHIEKMFGDASKHFQEFSSQPEFSGENGPNVGGPIPNIPGAEEIHEHLKGLFDGKIGSLAKELAEEIAQDMENLFEDELGPEQAAGPKSKKSDIHTTQDLLKKMMHNPKKMMELMKTIGAKIQNKMKSGEISEEEIMKEASELMGKMKGMGGKGQFAEIMKNMAKTMGQSGLGKGAKFNTAAFQKMERQFAAKERMQSKLEAKKLVSTDDPTRKVFHMEDSAEQGHSSALNDTELEKLFESEPSKKPPDSNPKPKGKGKAKKGKK